MLKLYSYWRSTASYRVRIALNLKGLGYDIVPVHLVAGGGEQHQADYQRLNPAELLPTLVDEDEDIILHQSLAIIEYLDERYEQTPKLLPTHKLARARVRALAQDIACDTQPLANLRVLQALVNDFGGAESNKEKWAKHWVQKGLRTVEQRLQNTAGDFCFGFELTLADLCLVPQVYNANRFGVDLGEFPLVARIADNCNALAAFQQALPENQPDAPKT